MLLWEKYIVDIRYIYPLAKWNYELPSGSSVEVNHTTNWVGAWEQGQLQKISVLSAWTHSICDTKL